MLPIEDVPHTLFHDYDSRDCWQSPDEFWATVDEGYGVELEPYCWQPYNSDINSIYTNPSEVEQSQEEPSIEGTVTISNTQSAMEDQSLGSEEYILTRSDSRDRWYSDTDPPSYFEVRRAAVANTITNTATANAIRRRDPSISEIGDPGNLNNYLPDSGAMQHMTPRHADLYDVVEGQNLGVEVADGHIIKCSSTVKIKISMLDDRGDPIHAVLRDCMYVPGLSRRLFSVTKFAQNGHFATIKKNAITLYFGDNQSPVTLCSNQADTLAADAKISAPIGKSNDTMSKQVPSSRHCDNGNKKRISLELLHHRLGHRKCRTILAAADGEVWPTLALITLATTMKQCLHHHLQL